MYQSDLPVSASGTFREKTRARPTVYRVPIPSGARWIATHAEGLPLAPDIQPHAKLGHILSTFIEAEESLKVFDRAILGEYLSTLHAQRAQLSVDNRIFIPVDAKPYHLRELPRVEHQYPAVSFCDGRPFQGPVIALYSTRQADDVDTDRALLNSHNTFARKGGHKRGTLGALLFGALETAGFNLWPQRHPWGTEAAEGALRGYFKSLQIVPGVNAGGFFALNWTKKSLYDLSIDIQVANGDGHRAFGLLLLQLAKVVGKDLYLAKGYPCDRITIEDSVRFPGWGRRFTSAFALVTYAEGRQGFCFRDAFVMPLVTSHYTVPSESGFEADTLAPLLSWIDAENSRGAQLMLRKRLFSTLIAGRLVRPDAEIEDLHSRWRFAVEILGFPPDWREYHSRKKDQCTLLAAAGFAAIRQIHAYGLKNPIDWHREVSLLLAAARSSRASHISGAKSLTVGAIAGPSLSAGNTGWD